MILQHLSFKKGASTKPALRYQTLLDTSLVKSKKTGSELQYSASVERYLTKAHFAVFNLVGQQYRRIALNDFRFHTLRIEIILDIFS